jgi:hypothetical protein
VLRRRLILLMPLLVLFTFIGTTVERAEGADVAPLVEGEKFATKPAAGTYDLITGARYSGGAALRFKADVTASHPVNCSAPCDVVLMASGGQTGGQPTFSVNDSTPQALTSTNTTAYTFHLPDGASTISVTAGGTGTGHNAVLDVAEVGGGTDPGGDRDGDTIPDASDNCPDISNPQQRDGDGDGIGNKCDDGSTTPTVCQTLRTNATTTPDLLLQDARLIPVGRRLGPTAWARTFIRVRISTP